MILRPSSKLLALGAFVAALTCASAGTAAAAPTPPMTVALHQPSGLPLSYFQLRARPGHRVSAGTLELRNRSRRRLTVLLDPIDAVTASTLGSAYQVRGLSLHGPARWTRLATRRVVLAPHGAANVAVALLPPKRTRGGDYLSGIGVQALERPQQRRVRGNVAISSIARYAIGLEVRLPGRRHPLIRLTKASVGRDPAGVSFLIFGRNPGNVILQGVHGSALITQGRRVAARMSMGPGTFVTGTSIAYPIPTPREHPRQGTVYRVRALLRYPGGVARLDTRVRFGRSAALRQQAFGGPKAPGEGGFPVLLVAIAALALALAVLGAALLWRRRSVTRLPLRSLESLLAGARASGEPLGVIVVAAASDAAASRRTASLLRSRLRPTDRLCRLPDGAFLVAAPDTTVDMANVLAADLRRHLDRANGRSNGTAIEVYTANSDTATELLERINDPPSASARRGSPARAGAVKAPRDAAATRRRWLRGGLALVITTALATLSPAPASAAVSFSTAPNAPNLPSVTLNAQAQTKNATMANWGATQTTTQSGWNVTVQGDASAGKSPVFKVYCPNATCGTDTGPAYVTGGATLPANSLKLNSTGAGWTTGTGTQPTHSCNSACNVDAAAPVKVASASTAVGLTTWTTTAYSATSLALSVPTTIRTPKQPGEIYRLDLIWTLNTGP